MEFKIKRNILAKTLGNVVKIIPPKSTYTILQNIIIEANVAHAGRLSVVLVILHFSFFG